MKNIKIAVDGHSSCGKSTLSKALAKFFGFTYIDTGAMYRAVTLFAMRGGIIKNNGTPDETLLLNKIKDVEINFRKHNDGTIHTFLNGEDVETEIRGMEVSNNVSKIAAIKFVRQEMVTLQRKMAQDSSVIMDGRDIGTVVFPDAELKIFVTARPEIRAKRRFDELKAKGDNNVTLEDVLKNITERDHIDSTRTESPLTIANDATILDNSDMDRNQQFEYAKLLVQKLL